MHHLCTESESIAHLPVGCSFAREVWFRVLLWLRRHALTPDNGCFDMADWLISSRKKLQKAAQVFRLLDHSHLVDDLERTQQKEFR